MLSDQLVMVLKKILREKRLNYRALAQHLDLSESSVKRIFSERSFSLERFLEICRIIGISFYELSKISESDIQEDTYEYSLEQELFFSRNPKYLTYFDLLLKYDSPQKVASQLKLSENETVGFLSKLEKISLIQWLPKNKIKFLTSKNIAWRKNGPLRQQLFDHAKKEFLTSQFDQTNEFFRFLILDLSERSIQKLILQLGKNVGELSKESKYDELLNHKRAKTGILLASRPWNLSILEKI